MDDLLTVKEVAQRTGLHVQTIHSAIRRRDNPLPSVKRGRDRFLRWSDVEAYLASRQRRGRYRADVHVSPPVPR